MTSAKKSSKRLFFSFNSKDLEDGYYLLTINCIAKSGEFKSSYPIDLLIDNTPPNEVQISGLVTEDGREKIGDSEYRIVRAEIIAKDQIGIDRIELYELAQNEADTPLAVTAEIESSQKIIQFCMDFSIKKLYQIYARAFDLSGNYRDSELKELKATR